MVANTLKLPIENLAGLTDRLIPDYYINDAPLFKEFVSGYLKFLGNPKSPYAVIQSLIADKDLELSLSKYLELYQNKYAKFLPKVIKPYVGGELTSAETIVVFGKIFRNLREFYNQKSTDQSYIWLFRTFFSEEIEIETPTVVDNTNLGYTIKLGIVPLEWKPTIIAAVHPVGLRLDSSMYMFSKKDLMTKSYFREIEFQVNGYRPAKSLLFLGTENQLYVRNSSGVGFNTQYKINYGGNQKDINVLYNRAFVPVGYVPPTTYNSRMSTFYTPRSGNTAGGGLWIFDKPIENGFGWGIGGIQETRMHTHVDLGELPENVNVRNANGITYSAKMTVPTADGSKYYNTPAVSANRNLRPVSTGIEELPPILITKSNGQKVQMKSRVLCLAADGRLITLQTEWLRTYKESGGYDLVFYGQPKYTDNLSVTKSGYNFNVKKSNPKYLTDVVFDRLGKQRRIMWGGMVMNSTGVEIPLDTNKKITY